MTDRDRRIIESRFEGVTVPALAEVFNLSKSNIQRIIYSEQAKDYMAELQRRRDARPHLPPAVRVQKLQDRVIAAMEERMDRAETAEQRIALARQITELSRQVGDAPAEEDSLPVVILPGTFTVEAFNARRALAEEGQPPEAQSPTGGAGSRGGSEMSPPAQKSEIAHTGEPSLEQPEPAPDAWRYADEDVAGSFAPGEDW